MAVTLTIGGQTYFPGYAERSTIHPVDSLRDRADTMSGLQIKIRFPGGGNVPEIAIPKSGQEIILDRDGTREFGGVVRRVRERPGANPDTFTYEVAAADYTQWFDRFLVQGVKYASDLAGDIVRAIVSDWANQGTITWDVSQVEDGPTIPEQTFDFQPPSACIDTIAKLIGYHWQIDFDRRLVFRSSETNQAPIATVDCENLLTAMDPGDIELEDAADQALTTVYIKDAKTRAADDFTEHFTGDGSQTFFPLGFEPSALGDATIVKGATTYSVAGGNLKEENVDGKPGDGQTSDTCYLCLPNWGFRFNPAHAPTAGQSITATYNYLDIGPAVNQVVDSARRTRIAIRESTDGNYEEVLSASHLVNVGSDAVRAYGELMLAQRDLKILGSMVVYGLAGWRAGQYFQFVSRRRLGGVNQRMYVTQVTRTIVNASVVRYDVEFASDIYGEN